MRIKIAYHVNEVNYRGLFRACIDYIKYGRKFYGWDGIIVAPDERSRDSQHHPLGKVLCQQNHITLVQYPSGTDRGKEPLGFYPHVDNIIKQNNCNVCYIVKRGDVPDDRLAKTVPNICHGWAGVPCRFDSPKPEIRKHIPDGDANAGMSRLASMRGYVGYDERKNPILVEVPTIIEPNHVQGNLRHELGVPENDIIFGNMGGDQVFNMIQPKRVMGEVLKTRKDIWFIFMGIKPIRWNVEGVIPGLEKHPQIKWLAPTVDDTRRYQFINTCDAMIHGRREGEMGGGAISEFSISNKPIFTSCTGKMGARMMLGKKAFVYYADKDLYDWIMNFNRAEMAKQNWDCYSAERFPEPAMKRFKEIFIDPIMGKIKQ